MKTAPDSSKDLTHPQSSRISFCDPLNLRAPPQQQMDGRCSATCSSKSRTIPLNALIQRWRESAKYRFGITHGKRQFNLKPRLWTFSHYTKAP
ncbi:hypothetical protein CEXT_207411 [Caerostris extrusa]|uniref:Uncharacterized protein n=1 Tax=Caerostris extrusa TaxID=172846 RepID=A0AAV4VRM9_CAEEX|nr:hypothetical protein CEXT_207411 [Caerostris extrusa]